MNCLTSFFPIYGDSTIVFHLDPTLPHSQSMCFLKGWVMHYPGLKRRGRGIFQGIEKEKSEVKLLTLPSAPKQHRIWVLETILWPKYLVAFMTLFPNLLVQSAAHIAAFSVHEHRSMWTTPRLSNYSFNLDTTSNATPGV